MLRAAGKEFWVAAERLPHLLAVYPDASLEPRITPPKNLSTLVVSAEEGLVEVLRGRLEAIGPVTVESIAEVTGLPLFAIESAMTSLEAEGYVMRGRFTPAAERTEWCVRRLLARIHRYTLHKLRKEIEPVSSADFMRFLLVWHRVASDDRGSGVESVSEIVEQLEGFEAAAAAWEGDILPARLEEYEPEWLDALCLSGRIIWARFSPPKGLGKGIIRSVGSGPIRTTPIALINRKNLAAWDLAFPQPKANDDDAFEFKLSSSAIQVFEHLQFFGASFFTDFVENTGLLKTQVEEALAELVAFGLITADSFTGLRALLIPSNKRTSSHNTKRKARSALFGMENAGRWSRVPRVQRKGQNQDRPDFVTTGKVGVGSLSIMDANAADAALVERIARTLLRRYGVVFRRLMDREGITLPWRDLLRVLRRLEARGEIRGGRFVAGFAGEQFALAEAISMIRSIRRTESDGRLVSISAADPLNLVGIVLPGPRVPIIPANRILYRDGIAIAILEAGQIRFLVELEKAEEWKARTALIRRPVPPQLRAYLGKSA